MRVSIVGGGYVGLVTGACFSELGHQVTIVEIDPEKIRAINAGSPPIYEEGLEGILKKNAGQNLNAEAGYTSVAEADIVFICVGTPPKPDGSVDLSYIESASSSIGKALQNSEGYCVVVVKSTVPPDTTGTIVRHAVLHASGRTEREIGFAMNPEFLREGRAVADFMKPDRIVIGSSDPRAGHQVERVYDALHAPVIHTKTSAAEMIKYASNAFLATKVSFSNEMGNICKMMGIDVYEVMKGVGLDHRIGPLFLNAGTGFGGSCFPKDVSALVSLAEARGLKPELLQAVLAVNEAQPSRMIEILEKRAGPLDGKQVAVLGLAFKDNTDDIRDSRAIPVIQKLLKIGARISAYDPLAIPQMKKVFPEISYHSTAADALRGADACIVMTEWPEFSRLDREFDLMAHRIIIEGRKILTCKGVEGICW
ncbi:MAG: UDP-glucose/GDP-mannose dehydrogenase family protein [Methanospirillum sp.]|nr:UDP-glucose/GDP-mannose dehydrogenase family protein [Methanospirillum sp.]